jgi:glycosyltransferase involved in cell wall biosynthesis
MTLTVAVFSFNRGGCLRNCLDSLSRNMPFAKVVVYDDGSTEAETLEVLAGFQGEVIRPESSDRSKHGGLYRNMQRALDRCETDLLFFLQEDMQIVRPVAEEEVQTIRRLLDARPDRAFVYPAFLKAVRMRRYRRKLSADAEQRAYVGPKRGAKGWDKRIAYYDVCIADVARLRAANWQFQDSENANVLSARERFADMPFLGDPFVFYCPEVPIFRNREQSLAARITGRDVKAFHDLSVSETKALKARDIRDWPVAEKWLRPVNPRVRRPFVYKDVKARFWLNVLHRLEQALRR